MSYYIIQAITCILCGVTFVSSLKNRGHSLSTRNAKRNLIISLVGLVLILLGIKTHSNFIQILAVLALTCEYFHQKLVFKQN